MNLFNYFAIETALRLSKESGWRVTEENILRVQEYFKQYVNNKKFVLIPRFNGNYISFRYCGLEVLRLTKKGIFQITIKKVGDKIRNAKPPIRIESSLEDGFGCILDDVKKFLEEFNTIVKEPKEKRKIPGFSLEHWLESLILADSENGVDARKHIGINSDLKKVVTQVPVIMKPKKGGVNRRHHHIDILSFNENGKIAIVELKKDDNLNKAKIELTEYSNWLLGKGDDFDEQEGYLGEMIERNYLPKNYLMTNIKKIAPENIECIAVILNHSNSIERLDNKMRVKIIKLPSNWLSNMYGNPFKEAL